MSQNQTERFGLHLWEAEDYFLRTEFNENFARLDTAMSTLAEGFRAVTGTYVGDGTVDRLIDVGFRPKVVLAACRGNSTNFFQAIYVEDGESEYGALVDQGFTVKDHLNFTPAPGGYYDCVGMNPYHYIALWWAD